MAKDGLLANPRSIASSRHPSAVVLSHSGGRLYVGSATADEIGVIDTHTAKLVHVIHDAPPSGPHEGSTPNALALSRDGKRLFIAEADNNAVAVADVPINKAIGRMTVDGYPTALIAAAEHLIAVHAKGKGRGPHPS